MEQVCPGASVVCLAVFGRTSFIGGHLMLLFDKVRVTCSERSQFYIEAGDPSVSRFNCESYVLFPGFCDVHVHFREPGFSYKETIKTGTLAAAHGGYSAVCTMPNLNPVPDCRDNLAPQLELIHRDASVAVFPYGSITKGEAGKQLSDLEELAEHVIAFSDDGFGVKDGSLMREAMVRAKKLGMLIAGHCEDIRYDSPREREWREIERNISLADETGCAFHVCHISTAESVFLIREAKKSRIDVSCETAPHYLVLDDSMLSDDGRFKMNPPIHSKRDREALLDALCDGTVDMIATDHAPHAASEKAGGFRKSLNGVVGLETAFPVLYSQLVKPGVLSLDYLISLLTERPRKRFGIPLGNDFSVWDLGSEERINPASFLSLGKSTPFDGWQLNGKCLLTVFQGNVIWEENKNGKTN